ncbi:MAG: tetratricopeptide repeat protein [Myxococcota bacterium]|nr:tetratricopeptide repeat protein [Myxococcota bacterium]
MPPKAPVHLLYALSGAASLGYQVCWFRIFVGVFGSSTLTFALVVGSFIGGLGAGALASRRFVAWLSPLLARRGLRSSLAVYGAIEALVVATAAASALLLWLPADLGGSFPYVLQDGIWAPTAAQRWLRAGVIAGAVFAPCFFMGTTFPLLCRAFAADPRFPSALYAANTAGACLGILACELLLFPSIGHWNTFGFWLLANLTIALVFVSGAILSPDAATLEEPAPLAAPTSFADAGLGIATLFAIAIGSGFLTGSLEVDVVRRLRFTGFRSEAALSFVSFWAVLGIFLGSASVRLRSVPGLLAVRLASAGALLAYAVVWIFLFPIEDAFLAALGGAVSADALPADLPAGLVSLYRAHSGLLPTALFTGVLVFPPLFLLATLLPAACDRLQARGRHLGRAYGLNTLAFCAGTFAFGWVAPRVDVFYSTQLFLGLFAATVLALLCLGPRSALRRVGLVASAGIAVACLAWTPRGVDPSYFRPGDAARSGPVRALRSDGATTTFVVGSGESRHLYFDAFSMSATTPGAQRYMRLMAHFPLLLQPDPRSALVICFGVGNTASAVAAHSGIERLDVVDLNAEVFRTAEEFAHSNRLVARDPRVRLIHDDGRRFLSLTDERYDLVTSEPPPPRHEGVYRLYSKEYYEAASARLTERGMMTQWLTVRQMAPGAVELAIRSFVEVFPHTLLYVGAQYDFILLGSRAPLDLRVLERRYREAPLVRKHLEAIEVRSVLGMLARVVRSDSELRADVGHGRLLSDLRNDWSYEFFGSGGVPRIGYDPVALWDELGAANLASGEDLLRVTRNVGLLRSHVRDFPLGSLEQLARSDGADGVRWARVDWGALHELNQRGHDLLAAGRPDDAAAAFRESLDRVPDQIQVWLWLARLEEEAGDAEAARAAWEGYVRHHPGDAFGRYRLGLAWLAEGRPERARDALLVARGLAPESPEIERALRRALEQASANQRASAVGGGG